MLKAKVPLSAQQTNKTESQHAHRLNFNRLLTRPHRPFCRWNSSMPGRTEPTTPKHTPSTRPSLSTGLNLTFQYQLPHLLKQRNLRRPMLHCGSLTLSCEPSSAAVPRSRGGDGGVSIVAEFLECHPWQSAVATKTKQRSKRPNSVTIRTSKHLETIQPLGNFYSTTH